MKRSLVNWYGGKSYMINDLLPLFPAHHTYVEVFGGAGHLLCAKPLSPFEVYNDIDEGLTNFFKVVADATTFESFHRKVSLLPCSRILFFEMRDKGIYDDDPIERAVSWFYVMRYAFSATGSAGRHSKWGYAITNHSRASPIYRYLSIIKQLPELHARLQRVQIDNRDFRKIFNAYDAEDTFFYCDPPYILETQHNFKNSKDTRGHAHGMTLEDHEDLIDLARSAKGKVIVSHYPHALYETLIDSGWDETRREKVAYSAGKTKMAKSKGAGALKDQMRTEVIWRNPAAFRSAGQQIDLFGTVG